MATNCDLKKTPKFICKYCDFSSHKKSEWIRHCETKKHKSRILATNSNKKTPKKKIYFTCNLCNKEYKDRSGLWRHKKGCFFKNDKENEENEETEENEKKKKNFKIDNNFVLKIMKQNNDLQTQIVDLLKKGTHTTTNNNNTFNLQIFLNVTCKNAMNITDFTESVKPQLDDLEKIGKLGFIEGISNIILKNLSALDISERPVHCSDLQRDIVYIKDEDKWEKEDDKKNKLRKTIREVANKNIKLLSEYAETYPNCKEAESSKNEEYLQILLETMGGPGENIIEKEEKIIQRLTKEVEIA